MRKSVKLNLLTIVLVIVAAYGLRAGVIKDSDILGKRPMPIRSLKTVNIVKVRDFGAVPDKKINSLEAVGRAVKAAVDSGKPTLITFEPGKYYFHSKIKDAHCIVFNNAANIVLDGRGAEFIIQNPQNGAVLVQDCRNVILKNFSVDYEPLPYCQSIVTKVDKTGASFDVEVEKNSPELDQYFFKSQRRWGVLMDRKRRYLAKAEANAWVPVKSWTKLGPRRYRIKTHSGKRLEDVEVGDPYLQVARQNKCKIIMMRSSENITIENIITYSCPASPYTGSCCSNIGIFKCKTLIRPGRWIASNGDAVHCQRNIWGPWVEGCQFDGICDDAMNIYTVQHHILEQPKANAIRIKNFNPSSISKGTVGATAYIFDVENGILIDKVKVKSTTPGKGMCGITFERDIPELKKLGSGDLDIKVFFSNIMSSGFVVKNNLVRYSRRFGIAVPTSGGIIENNIFEECAGAGISVSNHQRAAEKPDMFFGCNLIIRNNIIKNGDFDHTYQGHNNYGGINISILCADHRPSAWKGLENILIEGNKIYNWRRCAIRVCSAKDNVVIRNNSFISRTDTPLTPNTPHCGIFIENSDKVTLENNKLVDERKVKPLIMKK